MLARSYLRASTDEQDASRAREQVERFAAEHGLTIAGTYVENESGAKLARPELFRLLADSKPGDVLLIEQVDRLSRLTSGDWQKLRAELDARQVRVVALDLPTSWMLGARAVTEMPRYVSRGCRHADRSGPVRNDAAKPTRPGRRLYRITHADGQGDDAHGSVVGGLVGPKVPLIEEDRATAGRSCLRVVHGDPSEPVRSE